jgi:RNA polymerase sigma factor (sigma-70 family)
VLDPIRDLLGADTGPSDAQLLDAFARGGEEAAFTLLVRRHGRLVWGVCRRVLRDPHDAEDAFQATFLVLAKKAASIRKQSSVGSWLYGVAYRLACQLRKRAARRRRHEGAAPDESREEPPDPRPEPAPELSLREALAILDEEVGRLPQKFRDPVVLCYLQGKTNEEAARELRCPAGTVKGRLLRARELLCARLTRRGAALSAAALAVLLATAAEAAVAPAPLRAAVVGALAFAGGGAASDGAARLAKDFLRTMTVNKIKRVAGGVLVLGLLASAGGVLVRQAVSGAPPAGPPPAGEAPAERPRAKVDAAGDALPPGALARLGTLRWRHGPRVSAVAFAAGGKEVVTAGPDGVVRAWDAADGKELRHVGSLPDAGITEGLFQRPTSFSADGGRAVTTGDNGALTVWDVAAARPLRRFDVRPKEELMSVTLTPDGKGLLISKFGESVVLWDVATGKEVRRFEVKAPPAGGEGLDVGPLPGAMPPFGAGGLAFSPDGKVLAGPFVEGLEVGVRLWDATTGKEVRRVAETMKGSNDFPPYSPHPAFSPDGKLFARVAIDGTIRLHATADGKEARSLGAADRKVVTAGFVFSPDGKALAALRADRSVCLYDAATGKELRTLGEVAKPAAGGPIPGVLDAPQFSPDAAPLAVSPDGKVLAVASAGNAVRLWDLATGRPLPAPAGHTGSVLGLGAAADGKTVVTLGSDGTLRQWDAAAGKELRHFRRADDDAIMGLSPTGRLLARLEADKAIVLRDVAAEKDTVRIELPAAAGAGLQGDPVVGDATQFFYFSADEKVLAARVQSGAVHRWDTATGKALRTLPGPEDEKNAGAESPFGLAMTRDGRKVLTIGLVVEEVGAALPNPPATAPAPPRTRLRLWDTLTGTRLRRWETPETVSAAAFTPDGRSVAAVTEEGVRLWEVATGQLRYQRKGAASFVACSPDGRTLAVAAGPSIRLIDVRADRELARFKGHRADVQAMAFTRDGKALVSASADSTAIVWDATSRATAAKADEPGAGRLDELWKALGGDADKSFAAAAELAASPKAAVALLAERVKPATEPDAKSVTRRIADLDSDSFDVRQQAAAELGRLGELARPALDEALKGGLSAEARRQVEELLAALKPGGTLPAEELRLLRAVEVLEWAGTPEARKLIAALARGAARARLTRAAADSLQRTGE